MTDDRWTQFAERAVLVEVVRQAQAAYCAAFDRADLSALEAMFTPEASFERPQRRCEGWPEISRFFQSLWAAETSPTRHFLVNAEVNGDLDGSIHCRASYFLILGSSADLYVGWGDYDDQLEWSDGQLRFVRKSSTIEGLLPIAEGWQRARTTPAPWAPGRA